MTPFLHDGGHDEHALHAQVLGHDLRRRDRLDGLAQAHLIADEAAPGADGEEGALLLIVVELDFQECIERGAVDAAREGGIDELCPAIAVAHLGDE